MAHPGVLCSDWRGVRAALDCTRAISNCFGVFLVMVDFNARSSPLNNNLTLKGFWAPSTVI